MTTGLPPDFLTRVSVWKKTVLPTGITSLPPSANCWKSGGGI
ncbi:MAG: hypothetical protein OP8BY_0292 [Candidatus Saccharicenans subterraneus]|uniref:Uncharacterized protein n=1 Tax=Candidatus Saccharicenans subterraneus TaxID=2508984 RepID=A0A3E2BL59_9BACT|nr:MAG: hypothetical protein OP8BY_0292 [Candidatus Saccharicenans subterraneum]